ncbi:S8 family peptidase [Lysobacter sp. ESA13C]|uniref:S8 family peptidase n=1 Tax=Lysobacter sp. ESA13C TaxID=2862676 RepID=UPI001CBD82BC|nr:S8 family peptidase [Lysobacter sp. ESA13C]
MKSRHCTPALHCAAGPTRPPQHPPTASPTPRYSGFVILRLSDRIAPGSDKDLRSLARKHKLVALSKLLEEATVESTRPVIRSVDAKRLIEMERRAAQSPFPPLRSLTGYWRLDLRHRPDDAEALVARLRRLAEIADAYRELEVTEPVNDADDPYCAGQDYLDAAPTGIDARWAWTQANGTGGGIGVVDLEQGWFLGHEDLVGHAPSLIFGDNRDGVSTYKGNHGTAVLGEIAGIDNTLGVVGIAPDVGSVRVTSHYDAGTDTNLHVADAIVAALPSMAVGDVLLLEVQRGGAILTEVDNADFDAIRLASALGVIVVEAAGNGSNDLDAYTDGGGFQVFNRASADFRDSGAIVVGAALSPLPHNRAGFSSFGSRVDCYAWGENVTTCAYGDLDNGGGDDNRTYTAGFNGTSSASPIVTGAALVTQGMYAATTGTRLSPGQMRSLLSDPAINTPQGGGVAGAIGVMPDLRAIIEDTLGLVPDVYLRDAVGDSGVVPSTGAISSSPDVILRPTAVANPDAAFGEGSGTENSNTLGHEAETGQDNFLYVRMRNRGAADADDVRATVYWSPVATLLTPDLWNLIGTSAPVDVPMGDTLVVADAITWPQADIPAPGHYCFVASLDHPSDAAPPLPPGPPNFDWDAFRDYIRAHNNITWRNFNVVDPPPDPQAWLSLPFLITGTPDRARAFDFEIVRRLPKGVTVHLELPRDLARRIGARVPWKVDVPRKGDRATIALPGLPRLPLCGLPLPRGARLLARFLVRGAKPEQMQGASIAIRQLFEGEEVGRITWQCLNRGNAGKAKPAMAVRPAAAKKR